MVADRVNDIPRGVDQLTDVQRRIYEYIKRYIKDHGIAPTNREIGAALNISSTSLVQYHLNRVQDKGLIHREPNKARSITLTNPRGIPLQGVIAAGRPLEIFTEPEQLIDLDRELEHDGIYALKVKGDSMKEDSVFDGDIVVIRRQDAYVDGDIVVAVRLRPGFQGSATLKGFHREKNGIRLQPANDDLKSIFIPKEKWDQQWWVQGKVVAVLRLNPLSRYRLPKQSELEAESEEDPYDE